jgi:hypothetical protein
MPCRKNTNPRPNFAFVPVGLEAKQATWLKLHTGAARSHAAYWGGSAKRQRKGTTHIVASRKHQDSTSSADTEPAFSYNDDPAIRHGRSTLIPESFTYIQHDHLQHFPTVPSEILATSFPFVGGLATFRFFGEGFVKNFLTLSHEDYSSQ